MLFSNFTNHKTNDWISCWVIGNYENDDDRALMLAVSNTKCLAIVPPCPLRVIAAANHHEHRIDLDLVESIWLVWFHFHFVTMHFLVEVIVHLCCFHDLHCTVSRDFQVLRGHQHGADGLQPF